MELRYEKLLATVAAKWPFAHINRLLSWSRLCRDRPVARCLRRNELAHGSLRVSERLANATAIWRVASWLHGQAFAPGKDFVRNETRTRPSGALT
jgi:hypothetical protein